MTSFPTNRTQYVVTSDVIVVAGEIPVDSKRPPDDASSSSSSWLWAPYVTISSVLAVLIVASFVRFHCRHGHRYRTSGGGQLAAAGAKTTLASVTGDGLQLSPSSTLTRQWRPRYAWMDKNGAITSTTITSLASLYEPSFLPSSTISTAGRRHAHRSQRPSSIGPSTMIALHPTSYCRRTSTLDVVLEVRSEESIPDVVGAVEDSTERKSDDSPNGSEEKYERQFQKDDYRLGHQITGTPARESMENPFRSTERDLYRSGSASDSIDSGSSGGVSYENLTRICPEVTVDLPEKAKQCGCADTSSTVDVTSPGGTQPAGWVATFDENCQQPDDRSSVTLGPTEGVLSHVTSHVTDVLRTASGSTSHQLIMMGQLFVVVTSGVDTEQLIEDDN